MRKLKEVLRLDSLGLSQHQIARSCSISQSTVHEYVSAARAVGVKWPLPETWDDQQIGQMLFPQRPTPAVWRKHPEPDWTHIHQDLQTHKDLTLQLVWQECRENNPDGYAYSRFCDLYRHWLKKLDLVLRQEHRAGEKMFVDYAGATIPIYDPETEERQPGAVFVAVLGASNYTFAEVTLGQDLRHWIGSHIRAFEFFGGVTQILVPDNCKTGVKHPCYYEPDLNPTYREMGAHYGTAIIPARPYRPKDKDYVSYCTLSCSCRGECGLLGRSAALAFENRVLVQRFVETSPDIVVTVLLQQPLSSPSIDCSERHAVPHAHLFRRE